MKNKRKILCILLSVVLSLLPMAAFAGETGGAGEPGETDTGEGGTEVKTLTVEFNSRNGSGEMENQTFQSDKTLILSPNNFTKENCEFKGWSTDYWEAEKKFDDKATISASNFKTGETTLKLYAVWEGKYPVTLHLDANGGEGSMEDQVFKYKNREASCKLPENTFTKEGCDFMGWNSEKDGSGSRYEDEKTYEYISSDGLYNVAPAAPEERTIYAQWEPIGAKYTLVYHPNGGEGGDNSSEHACSDKFELKVDPAYTRTGYTLKGWALNTDGSGYVGYDGKNVSYLGRAGNTVNLYAVWTPNTYTVKFSSGATVSYQSFTYDEEKALRKNTFTHEGYGFSYWQDASAPSKTYTDEQVVKNLTPKNEGEITLQAVWTETGTYTVHYDKNGGSVAAPGDETWTCGAEEELSYYSGTKEGYAFWGWNTKAGGTGESYIYGSSAKDLAANGGSITLYAQWTDKFATLKFDANGCELKEGKTDPQDIKNVIYCSDPPEALGEFLPDVPYKKTGYHVNSWDITGKGYFRGLRFYLDKEPSYAGEVITLYAHKVPTTYHITFNSNGGEGYEETQNFVYDKAEPLRANTFTRPGYIFKNWNTQVSGVGDTYNDGQTIDNLFDTEEYLYLYAQWDPTGTYTVKFDANEGTGEMADKTFTISLEEELPACAFEKTGFVFSGWNTEAGGSGTAYADKDKVTDLAGSGESITLYAQWAAAEHYTVKFDANTGTGTMEDKTFTCTLEEELPTCTFTKTGYHFDGWNTVAAGGGTSYADKAKVKDLAEKDETATLYAQWKANTYNVKFDSNGGAGSMADLSLNYDEEKALTPNAFTRGGYSFSGWNTKTDGSGTSYADGASVKNLSNENGAEVMLYAQWKANTYSVKFDANGGTGSMADLALTYDEEQTLTSNAFTRTGYGFSGWNTAADGSGTSYAGGASVKNLSSEAGAEVMLYAQWSPNAYSVKFDANGGAGSMADLPLTYGVATDLTPNSFTRGGYGFSGWNTKADGTGTSYSDKQNVVNLSSTSGATVTLYAQWTPVYSGSSFSLKFDSRGGSKIASVTREEGMKINLSLGKYKPERSGYVFTGWYEDEALTKEITEISLKKDTTIYAGWKNEKLDLDTGKWENPFSDIEKESPFYDEIALCNMLGIMKGTKEDTFAPNDSITRGMIVTILHRLEEEPEGALENPFKDVSEGRFYTKAAIWAAENDIARGYSNGKFGSDDNITREQLATMLYRYAKYKGKGFTGMWAFKLNFTDADTLGEFAYEPMCWCAMKGIVLGTESGALKPKAFATRAEAATMLIRFINNI